MPNAAPGVVKLPSERCSPANFDAEEGLIACCVLDATGDIVTACVEAGITQDYLFKPGHQVIYGAILALASRGTPIDEIILAEKLHSLGQLDAVGGHAEINRLTNRVETVSHYRYWLEIVREKALLRKLISASTGLIERAYASTTDLPELLTLAEQQIADIFTARNPESDAPRPRSVMEERRMEKLRARAKKHRFNVHVRPPEEPWILRLSGVEVAWGRHLTVLLAPQKAAKSSAQAAATGSILGHPDRDYLGFQGRNPTGGAVLHYDMEQSAGDHDKLILRTLRRAGIQTPPKWFESTHLRPFDVPERCELLFDDARLAHKNGGLTAIMIDGPADMLDDVNNRIDSAALVLRIMRLMDETGCGVIIALHQNPSNVPKGQLPNDKGQGVFGTAVERKASMILKLVKTVNSATGKEEVTLTAKDARHALPASVRFGWDTELDRHATITSPAPNPKEDAATGKKRFELSVLAAEIFSQTNSIEPHNPMSYSELRVKIAAARGLTDGTAQNRIRDMLKLGILELSKSGLYSLKTSDEDASEQF